MHYELIDYTLAHKCSWRAGQCPPNHEGNIIVSHDNSSNAYKIDLSNKDKMNDFLIWVSINWAGDNDQFQADSETVKEHLDRIGVQVYTVKSIRYRCESRGAEDVA